MNLKYSRARLVDDGLSVPWLDLDVDLIQQVRIDEWRIVEVSRVLGFLGSELASAWGHDWSLRPNAKQGAWHSSKAKRLARGLVSGGKQIGPWDEVAALDKERCAGIDLAEFNGTLFVKSSGQHRIARAHQLGFRILRANLVTVYALRPGAERRVLELWDSLGKR